MKRTCLIIICCIVAQMAVAQCKITITLSVSGCSNTLDGRIAEKVAEAQANHYLEQARIGFNSLQECNTFRSMVISQSYSYGNCKIRFNVSPCTGCPSGAMGNANILAIGQGSSFYSVNGANEIRDWSNDDMERMIALNKDYQSFEPTNISTGDTEFDNARYEFSGNMPEGSINFIKKDDNQIISIGPPSKGTGVAVSNDFFNGKGFVSLDMRDGGSGKVISEDLIPLKERPADMSLINSYLDQIIVEDIPVFSSSKDYIQWIKDKYNELSGYDIDALSKKINLTETERQALANYRELYSVLGNKVIDNIKDYIVHSEKVKVFEMSVLSDDSYGGSEYMSETNWEKLNSINMPEDDPMKSTLNILEMFDKETGFHADLYYNNNLDEYTVSFEGSNMNPMRLRDFIDDWWHTNKKQGLGDIPDQYKMAAYITSHLPEGVKINFTGHSLGGGLASLCGAMTGKPTYIFNAEGVNENILRAFDIDRNKDFSNIKAYHTSNDLLSNTQDVSGKIIAAPAIGERINIGNLQSVGEQVTYNAAGAVIGTIASPGVGTSIGSYVGSKAMAHRIIPMEKHFMKEKEQMEAKFNQMIADIKTEHSRSAMRTIETIQISLK